MPLFTGFLPSVATVVKALATLLMGLVTVLIKLASLLVALALWLNSTLTHLDWNGMNSFILQGWSMFRDLANLGFVLGIIIIAFATIFRWKNYSASQILWKLIVAALLVNFSLAIISPFLVVSQNFSDYYLTAIAGGTGSGTGSAGDMALIAAEKTVSALNPLVYTNASSTAMDKIKTFFFSSAASDISDTITALVGIFIQVIIFMTLLSFAIILLVRYFFVAFLMMLSPIVWLLWIFPTTQKHWKSWWDEFIKWMIFPPAVLFFLNLSMQLYASINGVGGRAQDPGFSGFMSALTTKGGDVVSGMPFSNIVGSLMAVAMLMGGMMVASKIGVYGGQMATGSAKKVADYTKGKAKEYGTRGANRAYNAGGDKSMRAKLQGGLNKAGSTTLGKALFLDSAAQMHARGTQAMEEKSKAYVEAKLAGTGKQKAELARMIGGPQGRLAMAQVLADGDGGKYSMGEIIALHEGLKKDNPKGKEAQAVLAARGLNEGAIQAYAAGDRARFMTETGKAVSVMSSDDYARFMKNDGKAIAQGKYFADKNGVSALNAKFGTGASIDYRNQTHNLAYDDPAKTRATAAQITNSNDREKFFMDGAGVVLDEYSTQVADNKRDLPTKLQAEINNAQTEYQDDIKNRRPVVASKKKVEVLVERKVNLDKQIADELAETVKFAAIRGDITKLAPEMRKSKNARVKAFGDAMKLV
ncbi:MAG: hypothetical protein WC246_00200 [Candidatus Paceibacterota bacterium]|jgi:hypothetical protein